MKKLSGMVVGLACLGLLGACSAKTEMKESKMASESSMMSSSKMEDSAMTSESSMKDGAMVNQGEMAPDFELMGVDGKTHKLSDYKGKKVYIKFWASWCSICLSSLPETDELAKMEADDFVVLSIVAPDYNGEKSADDFKKWVASLEYKNLPVLLDQDGKIMQAYGVRSFPTAAFIGSDGVLVKTQIGFMTGDQVKETMASVK